MGIDTYSTLIFRHKNSENWKYVNNYFIDYFILTTIYHPDSILLQYLV